MDDFFETAARRRAPYPNRKISETFLAFAEPLLQNSDGSKHGFEEALKIAFTVWNAVVFADLRGDSQYLDQLRRPLRTSPELSALADLLIERKRTLFGDDSRLIGRYKVTASEDGFNVWAEARGSSQFGSDRSS